MFRRALSVFCLPCGRPAATEEYRLVAVADEDPVPLNPQEPNVVLVRFRSAPQQEKVCPGTPEPVSPLTSAAAAEVNAEERDDSREDAGEDYRAIGTMFRRALTLFCLPCGRPAATEEYRLVAVADEDPVPLNPQEPNVVLVRFRSAPQQEKACPGTPEPVSPLTSAAAAEVNAEERDDSREDAGEYCRVIGTLNDATIIETVAVVHASPDHGACAEDEPPRASRRRRGCRRCWAERLGDKVEVLPASRQGYRLAPRYFL